MELAQLAIVRAIADAGSIQAAARHLHRVPSNLTTRLRQLEDELGVALFIREKQRLRLSAHGTTFLDYARRILDLADQARQAMAGEEPRGRLALGALESAVAVRLPPILARFHQAWPQVELDLSTGPSGELVERVLAGELAAAFVDGPVPHPALLSVPLFEEELVLISAIGHQPITRAREVNGTPLFAFRSNCSYRRLLERWFDMDGAAPGHIHELESYHGMLACVSIGAGLALLPASMLQALPNHQAVQSHPLPRTLRRARICLVQRRDLSSPALRQLLEGARQAHHKASPGSIAAEAIP